MRKIPTLSLLLLIAAFAQAQQKPCSDVRVVISTPDQKVFTYSEARKYSKFSAEMLGCNKAVKCRVVSYSISVNGKPLQKFSKANFDFSNLDAYKANQLKVVNCIVEYGAEGEKPQTVKIPETTFTVIGEN